MRYSRTMPVEQNRVEIDSGRPLDFIPEGVALVTRKP